MPNEEETVSEDQATDSDASSSSAANAKVDVHMADNAQPAAPAAPPTFDPAVSNQLIAMMISQAQQELSLNMATSRNLVAASGAALTTSVQQIAAATTMHMFKMSPAEAQLLGLVLPSQTPK